MGGGELHIFRTPWLAQLQEFGLLQVPNILDISTSSKFALNPGASAGLGLALTQAVLARGDYVIATARSLRSFDELREDPNIDRERLRLLVLDVTSPMAEIQERVDEALVLWGRIDVLVNNAGIVTFGISEELG